MPILVALALLVLGFSNPATAGGPGAGYALENRPTVVFPTGRAHRNFYPMTKRMASVWLSDVCFRGCTGQAGWGFEACIRKTRNPEWCRARLDVTDRACMQTCRLSGGPLVVLRD